MLRYCNINLRNLKWAVIFSLLAFFPMRGWAWNYELYSQTVSLKKFANIVTQNRIIAVNSLGNYQIYGGVWWEGDQKTDAKEAYTDSQIAPLIGGQSQLWGNEWLYSRLFVEGRLVHRTTAFPDDRMRTTYEARGGVLGYGFKPLKENFFTENYYALFYTRLYGDRLIFQGWSKQGVRLFQYLDLFNEVFGDTFDLTRETDASFDLRPGARLHWRFKSGSVQLMHQWLHHFSNLGFSGRSEQRTTLVLGVYL